MTFNCDVSELYDGTGLAADIHNASLDPSSGVTTHRVGDLRVGDDPIGWLERVISFLMEHDIRDVVVKYRVVPSQNGLLLPLPKLHKDAGVDEELKDIAGLVREWDIRAELRHTAIHALDGEVGAGEWDSDVVVGSLIEKLNSRIDSTEGDDVSHEVSARLFAWISGRRDWPRLSSLPVFSDEYSTANEQGRRDVLKLGMTTEDDMALSPVASWEEDVQPYADLFPTRHTLAHFYFERMSDESTWIEMESQGLIRRSIVVKENACHDLFLPDDGLSDEADHRTLQSVAVTRIAFMSKSDVGTIDRVRGSTPLARTLWRFLTEWLVNVDSAGLQVNEAECVCGETHRYYPAEWIKPLLERKWIPVDGRSRKASAQSLASMLRGSGWSPDALRSNPSVINLLGAIGVKELDLIREFAVTTDDERVAQERALTRIIAGGDLDSVIQFVEDREADPDLPDYLAERRARRKIVHSNQHLGKLVEQLVKETLEGEGFEVVRTGIGSDFQIEYDHAIKLELKHGGRKWLVEVKATRDQAVRMTVTQAKTAVRERSGFLLCVVPISMGDACLETVRHSLRFVANIGTRLDNLCKDWDKLEELRDEITDESTEGIQLVVESGSARVQIVSSIWERGGFPLADLHDELAN